MNEIVSKLLLTGNKLMHEIHLRQLGFTYLSCGQFTKNKEKIQNFKETGNLRYSPSPVVQSRKTFGVQRKFMFYVATWPHDFQKNFGANHKFVN